MPEVVKVNVKANVQVLVLVLALVGVKWDVRDTIRIIAHEFCKGFSRAMATWTSEDNYLYCY